MQILGHMGIHHDTALESLLHMAFGNWPITLSLTLILIITLRKLVRS